MYFRLPNFDSSISTIMFEPPIGERNRENSCLAIMFSLLVSLFRDLYEYSRYCDIVFIFVFKNSKSQVSMKISRLFLYFLKIVLLSPDALYLQYLHVQIVFQDLEDSKRTLKLQTGHLIFLSASKCCRICFLRSCLLLSLTIRANK